MAKAQRIFLLLIVVFLLTQVVVHFPLAQESDETRRRQYFITKDMYMRCADAIAVYVKRERGWERGSYVIYFGGIDLYRNSAVFSVTSNAIMEEIEEQKKIKEYTTTLYHHEDDFSVLVDIVDYVVLSENTLDTYFPNAKPGYERVEPRYKKDQ